MKKKYMTLLAVFWILCLGAGRGWKYYRDRGDQACFLVPRAENPPGDVAVYLQKDEAWADDRLGDSGYTMGGSGCLTSCIASALSTQARSSGIGQEIDPGELNRLFGEKDVYNDSGDIVWDNIREALPKAQVMVAPKVDGDEVDNLLAEGKYPVVKVKIGGSGAGHWVLIVGTWDMEYLCMDPLNESGSLISLDKHENVAYRMRCVYWSDAGERTLPR